jgi:hypothetical protein
MVSDVGNMAGIIMQFAFTVHASDLVELLASADRDLLPVKEKRRGSIVWAEIFASGVVPD